MAFRLLSLAGWILVAVSSNVEKVLNSDDECAANAGDCSVELTQLRGVKHDVLVSGNDPVVNASASTSGGVELLSIVADSGATGCDWSGKGEFCKNWKTCVCGKKVGLDDVGEVVLSCVALPHLCTTLATNMLKEVIGTSVATNLVEQMLDGKSEVTLPSGKSAKAAILSGTHCKHCPLTNVCYPTGNEHRLCVAWDKKQSNPTPKGRSLLFILKGPGTASGKTEVKILPGSHGFKAATEHVATKLGATRDWKFGVKFDGTLAAIRGGKHPIAIFVDGAGYQHTQYQTGIFPNGIDFGHWDIFVKPNGDIVGCPGKHTGTGSTEIHVLTAISAWTEFGLQTGTALIEKQKARGQKCFMNENGDFVVVYWWWTGSGEVEVHVATKSSGYKKTSVNTRTGLPQAKRWSFTMAPNGDIYALRPRSDGWIWAWLLKPSDYSKPAKAWKTGIKALGEKVDYEFLVLDQQ